MTFVDLTGDEDEVPPPLPPPPIRTSQLPHPISSQIQRNSDRSVQSTSTGVMSGHCTASMAPQHTYLPPSASSRLSFVPPYTSRYGAPFSANNYGISPFVPRISPRAVISLSLINSREFTAKSDRIVSKEVISTLKLVPGVRFDAESKKWIFPISAHDRLRVALSQPSLNVTVDPLPRTAIAAVYLHHRRKQIASQDGGSDESADTLINQIPSRLYDTLAPFQRDGVRFVMQNHGRALIADDMGLGKAHPVESHLLTPGGWTTFRDIRVGDCVIGSNGRSTRITGVFPRGFRQTYTVRFSDGAQVEVSDDHLWHVNRSYSVGSSECSQSIVLSTTQMFKGGIVSLSGGSVCAVDAAYLDRKTGEARWEVPMVKPVNYFPQSGPLPMDPYTLGVLVASMCLCKSTAQTQRGIPVAIDCERDRLKHFRFSMDTLDSYSVHEALFTFIRSEKLEKLLFSVLGGSTACIPQTYLLAGVQDRLAVIQGIMDVCGKVSSQYRTAIASIPIEQVALMADLTELVQSMGGTAVLSNNNDVRIVEVVLPVGLCPFSLPYHVKAHTACCYDNPPRPHRRICEIIPCRITEVVCISVDAPDSLYVCEQYVVTHNTIQAIASAAVYQSEWPVLVVTPSSARYHWKAELISWLSPELITESDVNVVDVLNPKELLASEHKFLVLSYNILSKVQKYLLDKKYKVVIVDESHYLKNAKAQRTKALMPVLDKAPRVVMLTGTPALSRPYELFTQLHALAPSDWPSEKEFVKRYCDSRNRGRGSFGVNKGASNTLELNTVLLGTVMIRRLKKNILDQLPEKKRRIIRIEVKCQEMKMRLRGIQQQLQDSELEGVGGSRSSRKRPADNAHSVDNFVPAVPFRRPSYQDEKKSKKSLLMELFTESGAAKLDGFFDHLSSFLNDRMSGKVIIFAHHHSVMNAVSKFLRQRGAESIRIDGSTPSKERFTLIDKFQTSSTCRVAVLAITSAGVAITLTAASTVFFTEMFWTPGAMIQAEDRAHRIGQTSEVRVFYFLAKGTIDDLLWPMLRKKMNTLGEVFEGTKNVDLNADDPLGDIDDITPLSATIEGLVEELATEEIKNTSLGEADAEEDSVEDREVEHFGAKIDTNCVGNVVGDDPLIPERDDEFDGLAAAMDPVPRIRAMDNPYSYPTLLGPSNALYSSSSSNGLSLVRGEVAAVLPPCPTEPMPVPYTTLRDPLQRHKELVPKDAKPDLSSGSNGMREQVVATIIDITDAPTCSSSECSIATGDAEDKRKMKRARLRLLRQQQRQSLVASGASNRSVDGIVLDATPLCSKSPETGSNNSSDVAQVSSEPMISASSNNSQSSRNVDIADVMSECFLPNEFTSFEERTNGTV